MKLLGNTRIYGVIVTDVKNNVDYKTSATVRDLYDTLTEEGDNVEIHVMSPGGLTKADSLVKVKSINKIDDYNDVIYKFRDILGGLTEKVIGYDSSIYCSGDTRVKVKGIINPVEVLGISGDYEVTKMNLETPDMYSIQIDSFSNGGNLLRTSIEINGIEVMIN